MFPEDTLSLSLSLWCLTCYRPRTRTPIIIMTQSIQSAVERVEVRERKGKERKVEAKETWMLWMGSGRDNHS